MIAKLLFMAKEWLYYRLAAVDEHSLQSPFIFSFYNDFIKNGQTDQDESIEKIRLSLKEDHTYITLDDMGAGSAMNDQTKRKISYIARTSASNAKFSLFLRHIISHNQYRYVLELGTSLGINTMYMASAESDNLNVYTIEGSTKVAEVAQRNFEELELNNIALFVGNIDDVLNSVLNDMKQVDLAYLDANHTREATLRYFNEILPCLTENSMVVVDDIHWSPGMKEAWNTLLTHPKVTASIDLYDAGILFFRSGMQKAHFIIEF